MKNAQDFSAQTLLVTGARPRPVTNAPLNEPVVFSSTFVGTGSDSGEERTYGRYANPSWDGFEDLLGQLEKATNPAILFSSGMAAVAALTALVPFGGTVVVPRHAYQGSLVLFRQQEEAGAIKLKSVDITDTQSTIAALDGADLVLLESPTNPMLEIADLAALLRAAREAGIISVVDNTFNTPLNLRPLELGADVVVHSVTKYLAGHSDVILGAVLTSNDELYAKIRNHRALHGAIAGPMESFLALRGMRTLALRLRAAEANALQLAQFLSQHERIGEVRYPGLPSHPQHELATELLGGYGAILTATINPRPGQSLVAAAGEFIAALQLFTPATSLGGVESLIERRRRHQGEPESVPENLVRISVGIENGAELVADVTAALE